MPTGRDRVRRPVCWCGFNQVHVWVVPHVPRSLSRFQQAVFPSLVLQPRDAQEVVAGKTNRRRVHKHTICHGWLGQYAAPDVPDGPLDAVAPARKLPSACRRPNQGYQSWPHITLQQHRQFCVFLVLLKALLHGLPVELQKIEAASKALRLALLGWLVDCEQYPRHCRIVRSWSSLYGVMLL